MTLIEALEILKDKGITKLSGMMGESDIDKYIDRAVQSHEISASLAHIPCHQYHLDHENDHYIVETNGHFIIATHYGTFDMATYGNYDMEEEMYADFDEYRIIKQAEAIADQKVKDGSNCPRAVWLAVAINELRQAHAAAHAAFEREYGCRTANKGELK
ncbi:hypothetical protein [Sporomusa acidovorans]|uniref:hypothetical protein n=1 Tax=Sporomusa acidovorans TaxID=112900 RepID=UPI0008896332|nr:hypothetical protein [Sporomusa acidovorans]OZC19036.1 hypothetical protein SPACI_31220 [Sporomusa acidovorans DSM 3132]SDD73824.1 hypothetical protein SAMN04488499_1003210 [Sporomusa acidovorans]